jgi:hypothetical protein
VSDARAKVLEMSSELDKYIAHLESENRRLLQLVEDMREETVKDLVANDEATTFSHISESGK